MKSYLYLIIDKDKTKFKIGESNNVYNRYKQLKKYYDIDAENSYVITCKDTYALQLEKSLHSIFEEHNIISEKKVDGYSEWFDYSIFDTVLNTLYIIKEKNNNIISIDKDVTKFIGKIGKRIKRKKGKNFENIFLKKASILINSRLSNEIPALHYDIFNFILMSSKYQLMKIFGSEKTLSNLVKYKEFDEVINSMEFTIDFEYIENFFPTITRKKINKIIKELENISILTDILNNEEQFEFNLIKYPRLSKLNKIKYKLDPELFLLLFYFKPYSNYNYSIFNLKYLQSLSSYQSKKLYEFIIDWNTNIKKPILAYKLSKIMNLKYDENFKKHLKNVIKEINEKTKIKIDYFKQKDKNKTYISFNILIT